MIGKSLWLPAWTGGNFDLGEALARMSQERGRRVGGPGASLPSLGALGGVQVLSWSQGSCQHQWLSSSTVLDFSVCSCQRGSASPVWHPGTANLTPGLPWEVGGMAGAYLYALTARRPKNRHISDMHANVHSEQTHLVAREELPAWSSTVPLNWSIHIKERHLNNAKG